MKKITMMMLMVFASTLMFGQGLETFDNVDLSGSAYSDGSFTGQDGSTWTFLQSRGDIGVVDGDQAIMLGRNRTPDAEVESGTIANGIGTLNFDYLQAFSTDVELEVYVNNSLITTVTSSEEQGVALNSGDINVNVGGDIVIRFFNPNGGQVAIDNVSWTSFTGTGTPTISIDSPQNQAVLSPTLSEVDIQFSTLNLPDNATIDITVNGTTSNDVSSPFTQSVSMGSSYDVTVDVISGGNSVASDQVTFEIASATEVANITALRADVEVNGTGAYYIITGASVMTHADGFNNRKWFQDNTPSGIMIYDEDGVIADDAYMVGDNVEGLTGYTAEFNGVLQFIPTADAGTIAGNSTVLPQNVTLSDFIANFNDYESELIGFENVSIAEADGTVVFETGTNYSLTNGSETITTRTDFFSADYIGEIIPTATSNIAGVASEFDDAGQLFIRNSEDLNATLNNRNFENSEFALYPNPVKNGLVNIETKSGESLNVEFFNLLGQSVLKAETNQEINVTNLKTGVYLVKIEQNNNTVTKKLIIK
ncbi:T9SS type A sorting domain-containing protein [Psychroflexus aestuariivivens]|uniref:T9SS type A sorting domain-containing protein n=1 Tax=Psychroflexus aestuariivivens TaxID=1795040 RepID=UPI000FD80388|nr:T9SS type A sorting domain-containing protein [Psychroflexus aestuariivivens]